MIKALNSILTFPFLATRVTMEVRLAKSIPMKMMSGLDNWLFEQKGITVCRECVVASSFDSPVGHEPCDLSNIYVDFESRKRGEHYFQ